MNSSRRARSFAGSLLLLLSLGVPARGEEAEASHRERLVSPASSFAREEQEADAHLQKNPADAQALRARGLARLKQGKLDAAAADLKQAANLQPSQAAVKAELAFALLLGGRWDESLAAARSALTLEPENSAANAYAGHVLLRLGKPELAIPHLERAVNRLPANVDVHFDLLEAYRQQRNFPMAAARLRMLRFLLEPTDPRFLYQEGLLQADMGNLSVAIERLRAAVVASPGLPGAREQLGAVLLEAGRTAEAIEVVVPLTKERPASYEAAYLHALALAKAGRLAEAESEARRALTLNAGADEVRLLLGEILAAKKEPPRP